MALSKSISAKGSKNHHKFTLEVVEDSTSGNSSFLNYTFKISAIQTSWNWYGWGNKIKYTITINGTNYTGTIPDYDGSSTVTLKSGNNIEVEHDSNGTKTIDISFSVVDNADQRYTCGNANASGTFTLSVLHKAPDITNVTVVETNAKLTALSVANDTIVSNLSQKQFTITAIPNDGATLETYNVYYNDILVGTSSTSVVNCDFTNVTLDNGGLVFEVVDNQNGKGYFDNLYTIIEYTKPTINVSSTLIKRKTDGNTGLTDNTATLILNGNYYYTQDNEVGTANTIKKIEYKIWNDTEPSYTDITNLATITIDTGTVSISAYDLPETIFFDRTYNYKIRITDYFDNPYELTRLNGVPTGVPLWTEFKDRVDFKKITQNNQPILMPYSLYTNDSGSNGTIALSDSAANYEFIEIFYKDDINQYTSTKIYQPNGKKITLFMSVVNPNNSQTFVQSSCKEISGTSITHLKASEVRIDSHSANTSNYIYIVKVIGYK